MEQKQEQPEKLIEQLVNSLNEPGSDGLGLFTPELYKQLRQLSRRFMLRERAGHTMQPTDVVHEVLARLKQRPPDAFNDAQHFYATAAKQMRWVLVEYARHRRRKLVKAQPLTDDGESAIPDIRSDEMLLELHDALLVLEKQDSEAHRACELHYFGGHILPETAVILGVSEPTVTRRLRLAKAWLKTQIDPGPTPVLCGDDPIMSAIPRW